MTEDEAEKLLQTLDDCLTPPDSWHGRFCGRPHPDYDAAATAVLKLRRAIGSREILFQDRPTTGFQALRSPGVGLFIRQTLHQIARGYFESGYAIGGGPHNVHVAMTINVDGNRFELTLPILIPKAEKTPCP